MHRKRTQLVFVLAFVILIAILAAGSDQQVFAQGNPCPPGQEEQNGCKWVQHRITGRCMWLPAQAVSDPWVIVPVGTCPSLDPQPTATNTSVPQPTATNTSLPQPTATNTAIPQSTATITTVADPIPTNTSVAGPTATSAGEGDPEATNTPPLPTAVPNPPRQQPGGPGNLGYLVAGSLLILGGLLGGAFWLRRSHP